MSMQDYTLHKAKHHSLDTTLGATWIEIPKSFYCFFGMKEIAKCGYLLEAGNSAGGGSTYQGKQTTLSCQNESGRSRCTRITYVLQGSLRTQRGERGRGKCGQAQPNGTLSMNTKRVWQRETEQWTANGEAGDADRPKYGEMLDTKC